MLYIEGGGGGGGGGGSPQPPPICSNHHYACSIERLETSLVKQPSKKELRAVQRKLNFDCLDLPVAYCVLYRFKIVKAEVRVGMGVKQ